MALFNTLETILTCPRCGVESVMEVEFRFGFRNQDRYCPGDTLRWYGGGTRTPRQRPEGGKYTGEGYAECPNCHRDLWVSIEVRHDVIKRAEVDLTRPGYIPAR